MDEIYQKIEHLETNEDIDISASKIRQFYADQTIFITGSTGFLGQAVVEKLLRGCPEVRRIYLLIREKKNQSIEERLRKYFDNTLFDKMKKVTPNWLEKIVPVRGDCTLPNLGISNEIRAALCTELNIILHIAATVRFNEEITTALKINVLGTKEVLSIAKNCSKLKSFIHTSTAYAHGTELDENYYPTYYTIDDVEEIVEKNQSGITDEKTIKEMLRTWPNSYTFSKAIGENFLKDNSAGLPIGIFRPSIISSTYQEPIYGWSEVTGHQAAHMVNSLGLAHVYFLDPNSITDLVPVDMCANGILATAWDIANTSDGKRIEPPIYNYASSTVNPITWQGLEDVVLPHAMGYPPAKAMWYYSVLKSKNPILCFIMNLLTHLLPAILLDAVLFVLRKPRMGYKAYEKGTNLLSQIQYVFSREWKFDAARSKKLWDKMSEVDKKLFFCDLRKLSWDIYGVFYWRGLRYYCLKDPMETIPAARVRNRWLWILHFSFKAFCIFVPVYFVWKLVAPFAYAC